MPYCTLADLKEQIKEDELIQLTDDRSMLASGTLDVAISADSTTIILADASGFPDSGRVGIDSEQIDYAGKIGHQLVDCRRGAHKTIPAAHDDGVAVMELNTIDTSAVDRAIADADAEIDSYCATCYTNLPFAYVPLMIRKISVDISIYNLYARYKGAPPDRLDRYQAVVRFLENVAKGVVSPGADAPAADNDSEPKTTGSKIDRIFTMSRLSDSSAGTLDHY